MPFRSIKTQRSIGFDLEESFAGAGVKVVSLYSILHPGCKKNGKS